MDGTLHRATTTGSHAVQSNLSRNWPKKRNGGPAGGYALFRAREAAGIPGVSAELLPRAVACLLVRQHHHQPRHFLRLHGRAVDYNRILRFHQG
jgi:hypothetical protein